MVLAVGIAWLAALRIQRSADADLQEGLQEWAAAIAGSDGAGLDRERIELVAREISAHLSPDELAAGLGRSRAQTWRAMFFLMQRGLSRRGHPDQPVALAILRRCAQSPDAEQRCALANLLIVDCASATLVDLIGPLADDPHPIVALGAVQALSHDSVKPTPIPAATVARLVRALDYRSGIAAADIVLTEAPFDGLIAQLSDDRRDRTVPATADQVAKLESYIPIDAWRALAKLAPGTAVDQARRRFPGAALLAEADILRGFVQEGGPTVVPYLAEVALAADAAAARPALVGLVDIMLARYDRLDAETVRTVARVAADPQHGPVLRSCVAGKLGKGRMLLQLAASAMAAGVGTEFRSLLDDRMQAELTTSSP